MIDISKVYTSNKSGKFKIVSYTNNLNVEVEFVSTGYKITVTAQSITSGVVKDKLHPSVYGMGFVGVGGCSPSIDGKKNKAYVAWNSMLTRCYCPKYRAKRPTYIGCTVAMNG